MLILCCVSDSSITASNLRSGRCRFGAVTVKLQIIKVLILMSTLIRAGVGFQFDWMNVVIMQNNTESARGSIHSTCWKDMFQSGGRKLPVGGARVKRYFTKRTIG